MIKTIHEMNYKELEKFILDNITTLDKEFLRQLVLAKRHRLNNLINELACLRLIAKNYNLT